MPPSVAVPRQAGTACRPQRAVAQPKTGKLNGALKTLLAISDGTFLSGGLPERPAHAEGA